MDSLPFAELTLSVLPDEYAVCRLAPDAAAPDHWLSITRTPDELSVVCLTERAPANAERVESGWRILKLHGPFDFALTGILASVLTPLAAARVPIFALSTFDTDYVMVKAVDLDRAVAALTSARHRFV